MPRVSIQHVSKTFDGTLALADVTFDVAPGSVHALLGANGAGKSTLIKVLAGFYRPDGGQVLVDGVPRTRNSAISFIHQDLALVGSMSVAENIALLQGYPRRHGLISWPRVTATAQAALDVVGASIPLTSLVSELSRADQSVVAIARAVSRDCSVIVLDEPTASLGDRDVRRLFEVIRQLARADVSVIYVSHRLDEVFEIADRVTVLRDGRVVSDNHIHDLDHDKLVELIVGSQLATRERTASPAVGDELLALHGLRVGAETVPFDLTLKAGEIIGAAGLRGAGQEHLGRSLAGLDPILVERCAVRGAAVEPTGLSRVLAGIAGFASSRREQEGLAMTMSIRENMYMNPGARGIGPLRWSSHRAERRQAYVLGASVHLTPNAPENTVATLSGGNQQKVILGRWLSVERPLLVLEEPTMGVDVGARAEIYALIESAASAGLAVLVVSSDFEELETLCHRVLVMDRGSVSVELVGPQVTQDAIIRAASGAQSTQGAHT